MTIFQSTWPQVDISPCSYQLYSYIDSTLLAAPFFMAASCFCLAYTYRIAQNFDEGNIDGLASFKSLTGKTLTDSLLDTCLCYTIRKY